MNKEQMEKMNIQPNKIYRISPDELEVLKDISILISKLKKPIMNPVAFFRYLNINTPTGKTIVMASFDENAKINSCTVITHHLDDMMEKMIWIDFAWKDPNLKADLNKEYIDYINTIALQYGAKKIRTQMVRGVKAAIEKYGFKYVATTLEKEVKADDHAIEKNNKKDK